MHLVAGGKAIGWVRVVREKYNYLIRFKAWFKELIKKIRETFGLVYLS